MDWIKKITDKSKRIVEIITKIISKTAESTAEESKKVWQKTSQVASEVVSSTAEDRKKAWDKATDVASEVTRTATEGSKIVWDITTDITGEVVKKGKAIFRDDVESLRNECTLLNKWTLPDVPHSVKSSAILAAAGLGIWSNERELMGFTREIMDAKGTVFEKILEHFFDKENIEQISQGMDTIPGSGYIGGGDVHRVLHGHDIDALIELIKGHDITGAAEWFNHVALQDFWTPAGVPYLPFGNETVFEWLSSLDFVGKKLAADLLSINCAEVMVILLVYRSSTAFYGFIKEQIKEKKARELWDRAMELEKTQDYSAANQCYDQVLSYVPERPEVAIWTSMNYFRCAQQNMKEIWRSNLLRAYQIADSVRLKLSKDQTISYFGNTKLSLRGWCKLPDYYV